MTSGPEAWATLLELLGALAAQYRDDFRKAVMEAGLAREPVGMLLHAGDVDPKPLTATDLLACVPYYAEPSFVVPMQRLAVGGWLEPAGGDGYRLTDKGRAATDSMYAAARGRLAALSPLPEADLARLAQLLRQLSAACQASPLVTEQACLTASGNAAPWREPTPMATIARVFEALTNFRCDAHRAAWRPTGVDGPTWEALTWLCEGRADSAAGLSSGQRNSRTGAHSPPRTTPRAWPPSPTAAGPRRRQMAASPSARRAAACASPLWTRPTPISSAPGRTYLRPKLTSWPRGPRRSSLA